MPVVWVQHWSYLPVIVEDIDLSDGRQDDARRPSTQLPTDNIYYPSDKGGPLVTCMFSGLGEHWQHWPLSDHHRSQSTQHHTAVIRSTRVRSSDATQSRALSEHVWASTGAVRPRQRAV